MNCEFLDSLKRLQKHSAESVDYLGQFSEQSNYLHIDRPIQDDLIKMLNDVSSSNHKALVLLCGSAGDGKSHMLSYLLHGEHRELMNAFTIRNDATESDAPNRTAPETLADALVPFDDDHLEDDGQEKIVVAINLGLLSRFLESQPGSSFSKLRKYVDEIGVLKAGLSNTATSESPYFYSIDFSDYQIFTIENGEIKTDFLNALFGKVFEAVASNSFFLKYKDACMSCPADKELCPVHQNYRFLSSKTVQDNISLLLVEVALKERCVITARAALNFIYDLLVAPDFDIDKLSSLNVNSPSSFAPRYLSMTTPQLLFASIGDGQLVSKVRSLDPADEDCGWVDDLSVRFQASSEYIGNMLPAISDGPYANVLASYSGFRPENLRNERSANNKLKSETLRFIVRCAYISGTIEKICENYKRIEHIDEYAKLIYCYNTGDEKGLKAVRRELLSKAIEDWNGNYPGVYSLIKTYGDVQLLQRVVPLFGKSAIDSVFCGDELTKFRPSITIKVSLTSKKDGPFVDFQVDYNLFNLLKKIQDGYQPTLMDKHLFSSFENSYQNLLSQGNKDTDIYLARRSRGKQAFLAMHLDEDEEFSVEEL